MDYSYSDSHNPQNLNAAPPPPPPPHQQSRMHPSHQPGSSFQRMQQQRHYPSQPYHDNVQPSFNDIPLEPQRPLNPAYPDRHMSPSPPMHPGMGSYPPSHQHPDQPWGHDRRQDYQHDGYRDGDGYGHDRGHVMGGIAGGAAAGAGVGWVASHTDGDQYRPTPSSNSFRHDNDYATPEDWDHNRVGGGDSPFMPGRQNLHSHNSSTSQDALTAFAATPAVNAPPAIYPHYSDRTDSPNRLGPYRGPGQTVQFSRDRLDNMVFVDPQQLAEDGDLGLGNYSTKRSSKITLGRSSNNNSGAALSGTTAAGVAAGALAGGLLHRDVAGGKYGPVPLENTADYNNFAEKTALARKEAKSRKKRKVVLFTLGVFLVLGIIAATVVAIIVSNNKKSASSTSSGQSAEEDDSSGDLSKDSAEIKKLMGNTNLHKVFQGMAYTPFAAQYPSCLTNPPSQNNITRDMAVMSQLTNTVRLYGTDCNQTEMVLHAIDRLAIPDMKIWLGVWIGNNDTTNQRQIAQSWKILDQYGTKQIKGLAVGNEVLYRKDISETALANILLNTRNNVTAKGYGLKVATSDLGDNWTAQLASEVDVVMSNIHPFFAGISADQGAAWAINFWNTHDTTLTSGTTKGNIISEIGWPSQGGNDCGAGTCTSTTQGSVAGISQMNTFMDSWVCQALANGTDYFWFEAFDEPWKIAYNTPGKEWEDHWGLFDINRNLKSGLTIPNCGGNTVS